MNMEEKRKGTGQNPAPKNKDIITKIHNVCLLLLIIFILMVIIGQRRDNDRMVSVGIGIGASVGLIEVVMNTKEDDDEV